MACADLLFTEGNLEETLATDATGHDHRLRMYTYHRHMDLQIYPVPARIFVVCFRLEHMIHFLPH